MTDNIIPLTYLKPEWIIMADGATYLVAELVLKEVDGKLYIVKIVEGK